MPEYFAWVEDGGNQPVRRLVVSQEVSQTLEPLLHGGAADLLGAQDLIPLSQEPFKPDETEAWVIDPFELPDSVATAIANPIGVPHVTQDLQGQRVRCLIGSGLGANEDIVAFQVVDRRQVISQRALAILLDGDVFKRITDPGLLIGDEVHVVASDGRLVFRSLWWARRVFDLASHYIEATSEQIEAFANRPDVRIEADDFVENSTQWERKRISYLMQSGLLDETTPTQVKEAAAQYNIEVSVEQDGGQEVIVIPEEASERKALLKFLEEDYYQGPLTATKYVANSKRKV